MREIVLRSSRRLRIIVWGAHAAAIVLICFCTALPLWMRVSAIALVGVSLWRAQARFARMPVALVMNEDGTLSLRDRAGNWTTYDVSAHSYAHAGAIVLALRAERARRYEVLLSDTMQADDFRRLRVWLLWSER